MKIRNLSKKNPILIIENNIQRRFLTKFRSITIGHDESITNNKERISLAVASKMLCIKVYFLQTFKIK